ncbi:MAG TPA: RNA methyltransferase [Thermodesulfobacteriota bacterium]|nr:RNA methyltransferase [Thermodesulfobacteriota bacterium]
MITSPTNSRIKEIRLLKQAKHRKARGEYFIEGVRLAEEALAQNDDVRVFVHSPRLGRDARGAALLDSARKNAARAELLEVSDRVMDFLGETQTHQGVLIVLRKKNYSWDDLINPPGILLILHALQDPGNLGTIFRVAEAGGAAGLVLTGGTVDPYSPKVLRASMGSLFRLPFLTDLEIHDVLQKARSLGFRIRAAVGKGGASFWATDLTERTAVILGQEGSGLPREAAESADALVTIPMFAATESLNVAMTAGLLVYEGKRQIISRGESEKRKG